jgi:hypothetical protein
MKNRALAVTLAASLAIAANAIAANPKSSAPAGDATRLTAQYSEWAGGKSNADSLVAGLRNGAPITLVTNASDRTVSIAGFTPAAPMSYANVGSALSGAQRSLSRIGINKPNAEQIQAALIGGEILTSNGSTIAMKGSVAPRGATPVASR